jgi:hypothetical protein
MLANGKNFSNNIETKVKVMSKLSLGFPRQGTLILVCKFGDNGEEDKEKNYSYVQSEGKNVINIPWKQWSENSH